MLSLLVDSHPTSISYFCLLLLYPSYFSTLFLLLSSSFSPSSSPFLSPFSRNRISKQNPQYPASERFIRMWGQKKYRGLYFSWQLLTQKILLASLTFGELQCRILFWNILVWDPSSCVPPSLQQSNIISLQPLFHNPFSKMSYLESVTHSWEATETKTLNTSKETKLTSLLMMSSGNSETGNRFVHSDQWDGSDSLVCCAVQ